MLIEAFNRSDEEVENMPEMFRQLRLEYFEWKRTGRLPNGQLWQPPTQQVIPND